MSLPEYTSIINSLIEDPEFYTKDISEREQIIKFNTDRYISEDPDNAQVYKDIAESKNKELRRALGEGRAIPKQLNIQLPKGYQFLSEDEKVNTINQFRNRTDIIDQEDYINREDNRHYADMILDNELRKAQGGDTGYLSDKGQRVLGGFVSTLANNVGADQFARDFNNFLETNPEMDEQWVSKFADGLGSVGATFAVAAAGTALAGGNPLGGAAAVAAGNAMTRYNEGYNKAIELGYDEETAASAGLGALPGAVIDTIADELLVTKLVPKKYGALFKTGTTAEKVAALSEYATTRTGKRAIVNMTLNALGQGVSEAAGDATAGYGSYYATGQKDENFKPAVKDLIDSFTVGMAIGGTVEGIDATAGGKLGIATEFKDEVQKDGSIKKVPVRKLYDKDANRLIQIAQNFKENPGREGGTDLANKVFNLLSEGKVTDALTVSNDVFNLTQKSFTVEDGQVLTSNQPSKRWGDIFVDAGISMNQERYNSINHFGFRLDRMNDRLSSYEEGTDEHARLSNIINTTTSKILDIVSSKDETMNLDLVNKINQNLGLTQDLNAPQQDDSAIPYRRTGVFETQQEADQVAQKLNKASQLYFYATEKLSDGNIGIIRTARPAKEVDPNQTEQRKVDFQEAVKNADRVQQSIDYVIQNNATGNIYDSVIDHMFGIGQVTSQTQAMRDREAGKQDTQLNIQSGPQEGTNPQAELNRAELSSQEQKSNVNTKNLSESFGMTTERKTETKPILQNAPDWESATTARRNHLQSNPEDTVRISKNADGTYNVDSVKNYIVGKTKIDNPANQAAETFLQQEPSDLELADEAEFILGKGKKRNGGFIYIPTAEDWKNAGANIKESIKTGVEYFNSGLQDFAAWSEQMIAKFGEGIKNVLQSIWDSIGDAVMNYMEKTGIIKYAVDPNEKKVYRGGETKSGMNYFTSDKNYAEKSYGGKISERNINESKIIDLTSIGTSQINSSQFIKVMREKGVDIKSIAGDSRGEIWKQIQNLDQDSLKSILKEKGFEGIKWIEYGPPQGEFGANQKAESYLLIDSQLNNKLSSKESSRFNELESRKDSLTPEELFEAQEILDRAIEVSGTNDKTMYYHGARSGGFTVFDTTRVGYYFGEGSYFTSEKARAQNYQGVKSEYDENTDSYEDIIPDGSQLYKVVLNYNSPYTIRNNAEVMDIAEKMFNENKSEYDRLAKKIADRKGYSSVDFVKTNEIGNEYIREQGYDAIVKEWKKGEPLEIVVFNPSQIKSAELFTGVPIEERFDFTNKDIRYSVSDRENILIKESKDEFESMKNMTQSEIDNYETKSRDAGSLYEAWSFGKKMKDGQIKKISSSNSIELFSRYDAIAKVGEEVYGLSLNEDPDDESTETWTVSKIDRTGSDVETYIDKKDVSGLIDFIKNNNQSINYAIGSGGVRINGGRYTNAYEALAAIDGEEGSAFRSLISRNPMIREMLLNTRITNDIESYFDGVKIGLKQDASQITVLHEVTHATLDAALDSNPKFNLEIESLRNEAESELSTDSPEIQLLNRAREAYEQTDKSKTFSQFFAENVNDLINGEAEQQVAHAYALTGNHEFLATIMSDREFRQAMDKISNDTRSLLRKFIDSVREFFTGLNPSQSILAKTLDAVENAIIDPSFDAKMVKSGKVRYQLNIKSEKDNSPRSIYKKEIEKYKKIITSKLRDKSDSSTMSVISALSGISLNDALFNLDPSTMKQFFGLVNNIYNSRSTNISKPDLRYNSGDVISELNSIRIIAENNFIQKEKKRYEGVIDFSQLGDVSKEEFIEFMKNHNQSLNAITDAADKASAKMREALEKKYELWREQYRASQAELLARHENAEGFMKFFNSQYEHPVTKNMEELMKFNFQYLTSVIDIDSLTGKDLYNHYFSINAMLDGHGGNLKLATKEIARIKDESIEKNGYSLTGLAKTFRDKNISDKGFFGRIANALDKVVESTEIAQVSLQRWSAFPETQKFLQDNIMGDFFQAIMQDAENDISNTTKEYVKHREELEAKTGRKLTENDRIMSSFFSRLRQVKAGEDPSKALIQNIKNERKAIQNVLNAQSRADQELYRDKILPMFNKMIQGLEEYEGDVYAYFLKTAKDRVGLEDGSLVGQARIDFVDGIAEIFSRYLPTMQAVSEGFYGKPFTKWMMYVPRETVSLNPEIQKLTLESTAADHTGIDTENSHLNSQSKQTKDRVGIGSEKFYSHNIEATFANQLNATAFEAHTVPARMVLNERLKKDGLLYKLMDYDTTNQEQGRGKPRIDSLNQWAVKLVNNALTKGEALGPLSGAMRSVQGAYATFALSSFHQLITQPLAGFVDYVKRTSNYKGLGEALSLLSGNREEVMKWFEDNSQWIVGRSLAGEQELDVRRAPIYDDNSILNNPLVSKLNEYYKGSSKLLLTSMRVGDDITAHAIVLAEYIRLMKESGYPMPAKFDFNEVVNQRILSQAILNAEKNINTSKKTFRGEMFTDRKLSYSIARNLLFAFSSHQMSLSSQLVGAVRDLKNLKELGADDKAKEKAVRTISAILMQNATFSIARYGINAAIATGIIGIIRGMYDDDDDKIAKLEQARLEAIEDGDKEQAEQYAAELENTKAIRSRINKYQNTSVSMDGFFKSAIREGISSLHMILNAEPMQKLVAIVPDMIGQQMSSTVREETLLGYKRRISELKKEGDIESAARLTQEMEDFQDIEYIPLSYKDSNAIGVGGISGAALGNIYNIASNTAGMVGGITDASFADVILSMNALGVGQNDATKFFKMIDKIENDLSKKEQERLKAREQKAKEEAMK